MEKQAPFLLSTDYSPSFITDRLTVLWALNESGLGGIMHAIKSPFTGILVGGIAIILITLIANFADKKIKTIIKATTIVLIVKAIVSPHSPLPAYFAVGFQGLAGALLFGFISSHRLAALILGIVGLSESALQKIITLTLIYGTSLWESIDLFFNYVLQAFGLSNQAGSFPGSDVLIALYLGLYLLAGILVGYLAGIIPRELTKSNPHQDAVVTRQLMELNQSLSSLPPASIPFWRRGFFKFGVVLTGIIIVFTTIDPELKGINRSVYVMIRTFLVITAWYLVASPLLTRLMRVLLKKKQQRYANEVEQILVLLPRLRGVTIIMWKHAAPTRLPGRLKHFLLSLIAYTLTCPPGESRKDKNDHQVISSTIR
jgi:hypothetical protein